MDKEGKKLIIMGIISIMISSLALFSYRDVKFKNTKKMAEENAKIQAEIQAEIDQYTQKQPQTIDDTLPTTGSITMVLPSFFENKGLNELVNTMDNQDIHINFQYVTTIEELKEVIKNSFYSYDIYLIPKDWTDSLSLQGIYIGENIKPYFTNIFQDIISSEENTFIPYSIDPLITISKPGISNIDNRSQLFTYTMLWSQSRAYSIPILWGTTNDDITMLQDGDEPFENYFDILNWQINLIKNKKSSKELDNMLDIQKLDLTTKYNVKTFETMYNSIGKNNNFCVFFPADCFMSYGFADIKFGFLSDFDIFDKYFSEKNNSFSILNFTNTDNIYPVRGWGFVVPNGNKNINLATEFIKQYLISTMDGDTDFWHNTLPAINNAYDSKKGESKYKNLIKNEGKFFVINGNMYQQDVFVSDQKNLDVLRGLYSTEIYVNN